MPPKEKLRQWKVSSQTAFRLDMMKLVSGVEKGKLIDTAITILFTAVSELDNKGIANSGESIRTIVEKIPDEEPVKLSQSKLPEEVKEGIKEIITVLLIDGKDEILNYATKNVKKSQNPK